MHNKWILNKEKHICYPQALRELTIKPDFRLKNVTSANTKKDLVKDNNTDTFLCPRISKKNTFEGTRIQFCFMRIIV